MYVARCRGYGGEWVMIAWNVLFSADRTSSLCSSPHLTESLTSSSKDPNYRLGLWTEKGLRCQRPIIVPDRSNG